MTINNKVQICMFAYNLESTIEESIDSLIHSSIDLDYSIYVMVNGCRDNTFRIVSELSSKNSRVVPVEIEFGDKANAWNTFVHDYYDQESIPVFVDGDLKFAQSAIKNIVTYHYENTQYNAISGYPALCGRNSEAFRNLLERGHGVAGNLYLLSPAFIAKFIQKNTTLPIGLIGDDSMVAFLSATSLCSGSDLPSDRIGLCKGSLFYYEPLDPYKLQDIYLYVRRRARYSLRFFQQNKIVAKLKNEGISSMPTTAKSGFTIELKDLRWKSIDLIFDFYNYLKQGKNQ